MKKNIKIALPTDDGLLVGQKFLGSRGFLVATAEGGKIVSQEMRWNLISEILTSDHGLFYNLADCDMVIVNEIGSCNRERLNALHKEIVQTDQTEIIKALNNFLERAPGSARVFETVKSQTG
jgi:predicted Fe-Mo cluster-binding NifX family protein